MTFTMHHGVSLHTGTAIQTVEVKETEQLDKVMGMVDDRTETIAAFGHTSENTGTVTGKGDLTLSPGFGDADVAGISGGLTHIGEVTNKEQLGQAAEWSYAFTHMPHAAAA